MLNTVESCTLESVCTVDYDGGIIRRSMNLDDDGRMTPLFSRISPDQFPVLLLLYPMSCPEKMQCMIVLPSHHEP
jgi:hypothetical protein